MPHLNLGLEVATCVVMMADPATFAERTVPHRPSLLAAAIRATRNPHDAEDLVQETYLRACRAFAGLDEAANVRRALDLPPRLHLVGHSTPVTSGRAVWSSPETTK